MEKNTRQQMDNMDLYRKIRYLLQPEYSSIQEHATDQVVSGRNRYLGTIKTIFWYLLALLLSIGISKLH